MHRSNTCNEITSSITGKDVKLTGWASKIRDHKAVVFIDLRDRYGTVQLVFTKKTIGFDKVKSLPTESCISVKGKVKKRNPGTENKDLKNGDIEIDVEELEIYNKSPTLPFEIEDYAVGDEVRNRHRFLDLRSSRMQKNLILRSKLYNAIFNYMSQKNFVHVETPMLGKSTPEGSRDYIVPSRVHPGKFYALPQSPQLYKQMLMVSGFDKYFQFARCCRDEDLRADRQPEFTQLDIEMSFIDEEDIIAEIEGLVKFIFKEAMNIEVTTPFKRMTYKEAMEKHNSDKPDLRKNKDSDELAFLWVIDFPMFEWDEEDKKWNAVHHPFTSPKDGSNFNDPKNMVAKAYDLVLNGSEIGGGSIRIHDNEIQKKVFSILGISEKDSKEKFGFLLEALSYGAPPHGGIAFGLDRVMQIITNSPSIREVIAFPKNKVGADIMLNAPSEITEKQLNEAHIKVINEKR